MHVDCAFVRLISWVSIETTIGYAMAPCQNTITCPRSQLGARLSFYPASLETTQKLVLFTLSKHQIVVSQLTVFLFKFAFNFVPAPLHL